MDPSLSWKQSPIIAVRMSAEAVPVSSRAVPYYLYIIRASRASCAQLRITLLCATSTRSAPPSNVVFRLEDANLQYPPESAYARVAHTRATRKGLGTVTRLICSRRPMTSFISGPLHEVPVMAVKASHIVSVPRWSVFLVHLRDCDGQVGRLRSKRR
jgi:hypothetical protein